MKNIFLLISIFLIPSFAFAVQTIPFGNMQDMSQPIKDCSTQDEKILQSFVPDDNYTKIIVNIPLQNGSMGTLTGKKIVVDIHDGNLNNFDSTVLWTASSSLTGAPTIPNPPFWIQRPIILDNIQLQKNHFYWLGITTDQACDSNNWVATSMTLNTSEQVMYFSARADASNNFYFDPTVWWEGDISIEGNWTPTTGICTSAICTNVLEHIYLIISSGLFIAGIGISKIII